MTDTDASDDRGSPDGGRWLSIFLISGMVSPIMGGLGYGIFNSAWWPVLGVAGGLSGFGAATALVARRRGKRTIEVVKQMLIADRPPPENALERVAVKAATPILALLAWGVGIGAILSGQASDRIGRALWTAVFAGLAVLLVRPRRTRALDEAAMVVLLLLVAGAAVLDGFRLLRPAIFPGAAGAWAFFFAGWLGFAVAYDLRRPRKGDEAGPAAASRSSGRGAWLVAMILLVVVGFLAGLVLSVLG